MHLSLPEHAPQPSGPAPVRPGRSMRAAEPAGGGCWRTCVGTLHELMHTDAQPVASRYRQRSTSTPMPLPTCAGPVQHHVPRECCCDACFVSRTALKAGAGAARATAPRCCPPALTHTPHQQLTCPPWSMSLTWLGPMSHWHVRAVAHALRRQDRAGSGPENMTWWWWVDRAGGWRGAGAGGVPAMGGNGQAWPGGCTCPLPHTHTLQRAGCAAGKGWPS